MRLVSEFTLEENEVADGDTLRIRIKDGAGRPLELITVFIAGAVANGVLGNAAYDLLKSVSGQLKERFKSEVSSKLSTQDAAKIAVGCYCARFRIEDPSIVIVIGARVDIHNIGNIILHTDNGTVFVTIVPAQDGDPDALEIELELPWIPFGIMIFYLPLRRLHVTSGFTPALSSRTSCCPPGTSPSKLGNAAPRPRRSQARDPRGPGRMPRWPGRDRGRSHIQADQIIGTDSGVAIWCGRWPGRSGDR